MAVLTIATAASIDAVSAQSVPFISGLLAGEALTAVAPCYVASDGTVKMSISSACAVYSNSGSTIYAQEIKFAGFTADSVVSGEPVTLFGKGARFNASTGMTPGAVYFVGQTAGALSASAVLTGDVAPVAMAISATDIVVIR